MQYITANLDVNVSGTQSYGYIVSVSHIASEPTMLLMMLFILPSR